MHKVVLALVSVCCLLPTVMPSKQQLQLPPSAEHHYCKPPEDDCDVQLRTIICPEGNCCPSRVSIVGKPD